MAFFVPAFVALFRAVRDRISRQVETCRLATRDVGG